MTAKTRLVLLLGLIILFLIVAPYLVLSSLGYRIDFENFKIVATGGIYIRALPQPVQVVIDGEATDSTGIFSNSVFFQNLLPGEHKVLIKKEGYYEYEKNLPVKEKEVTKLENVTLFNKNIPFELLEDTEQFSLLKQKLLERFIVINNTLYYYDASPENAQLTAVQKNTPILRNIVAFKVSGNDIIWLGLDGFLKRSSIDGKSTENISEAALKINTKLKYTIEMFSGNIFLKEGSKLLLFDQETKSFQDFYTIVENLKLSPDVQKVIYYNDNEIFVYYFNENQLLSGENKILLQKSNVKITNLYWLNNDYIIFSTTNGIFISEIDTRGNINTISLPETLSLTNGETIDIARPEIFFNQANRELYILTQDQLIFSDSILP